MGSLLRRFDDLRIRYYSLRTIDIYRQCVRRFAEHAGKSPEVLGVEEIRAYQLHLVNSRRVAWSAFTQTVSAVRLTYRVMLGRPEVMERILSEERNQPRTPPLISLQSRGWTRESPWLVSQSLFGALCAPRTAIRLITTGTKFSFGAV